MRGIIIVKRFFIERSTKMPVPKKEALNVPKTARERVYHTLKEWIENSTLKPGEKLNDKELADYFEVSRTPVREAMQLLADQKLIDIYPGKESLVAPIDMESIKGIYEILGQLHALAVRFAAPKISAESISQLEKLNKIITTKSPRMFIDTDNAFHQYILDLAGNPFLTSFCSILGTHIIRFQCLYLDMTKDFSIDETLSSHQAIIDALKKQDLPLAEEKTRLNFTYITEKIDRFTEEFHI